MNETPTPPRAQNPPTPPPLPKGYKLEHSEVSVVVYLYKGDLVFNFSKPVHGWSLVEEDMLYNPDSVISIAVPVKPESVLQEAERLVNGDRQQSYGDASESFERIADFWHAYLKTKLKGDAHVSAKDVAAMMILMKVSRSVTSSKRDSWVDIAGYAELGSKLND